MKEGLRKKKIGLFLKVIIVIVFLFNDNNNTLILGDRILTQTIFKGSNIYFASGIIIVIFYFALKDFTFIRKSYSKDNFVKLILYSFLGVQIITGIWSYSPKIIKRFEKGLDAVYLYRKETNLNISGNDEVFRTEGLIKLKNLGNEEVNFKLRIKIPNSNSSEETYMNLSKEYNLKAKEVMKINIDEEIPSNLKSEEGFYRIYEDISLYNGEEEVIFKWKYK